MKKVVVIGGGTGSPVVLRALKTLPVEITSVTTAFDSGGSSRELRDEFGVLPSGDIRRCLVALSDGAREQTLRDLFAFRFDAGGTLNGHSFGNLLLTALARIYGSDIAGIKKAGEILNIQGNVFPVSLQQAHLVATFEDGSVVQGETHIDVPEGRAGDLHITNLRLEPPVELYREVHDAIIAADLVILAPGDLYTSLVPNMLVHGMPEALAQSAAKKAVMINFMTKWGETHGFVASDFAREVAHYSGITQFDYALFDSSPIPEAILDVYAGDNQYRVALDDALSQYARTIISAEMITLTGATEQLSTVIRHDPFKLAKVLYEIIEQV